MGTQLLAMTAIAMLPVLALAGLAGLHGAHKIRADQEIALQTAAQDLARAFDQEITTQSLILATLAETVSTADFAAGVVQAADRLGSMITISAAGGAALLRPRLVSSPNALDPALHLIVPVHQIDHETMRLDLQIAPNRLAALMAQRLTGAPAWSLLIDPDGRVALASQVALRLIGHVPASPAPLVGHAGESDLSVLRLQEGPTLLVSAVPSIGSPGWRVIVGQDAALLRSLEDGPMWSHLVTALVGILASLLLAVLLNHRLSRPLRALTLHAQAVALGAERAHEPLPVSSISEFEALRLGMIRADAVLRRRVAAERMALREARTGHELLDSVVNATAECIYVKDLELRYVLVNSAALLCGPEKLEEWQVLGRAARDLYPAHVARRIELADRAVLSSGRMTSFDQDIEWPGQPVQWMWFTITPWQDAEGRVVGVVSVSRDITEQRATGFRLRGMQADLLRATRLSAMGAMASGLAHELNQPLAAATNYLNASARLLDHGGARENPALAAARGAVSDSAQQLLRAGAIVRRLRDFVGRGEAELQLEDVSELIRGVVDLAKTDGSLQGVDLRMVLAPYTATVLIDLTQIQQVLLNLIRNAAEAITLALAQNPAREPGIIVLAAVIRPPEGTCVDVIDNGPGLAPHVSDRLFEPFISTKSSGMGIGLTICRTIVEGHGGQLLAQPANGGGMRFRIALPPVPQAGQYS